MCNTHPQVIFTTFHYICSFFLFHPFGSFVSLVDRRSWKIEMKFVSIQRDLFLFLFLLCLQFTDFSQKFFAFKVVWKQRSMIDDYASWFAFFSLSVLTLIEVSFYFSFLSIFPMKRFFKSKLNFLAKQFASKLHHQSSWAMSIKLIFKRAKIIAQDAWN